MKHIGNLHPALGAKSKKKRIARGIGSGHGNTATRGHKGYQSRRGSRRKRAFEGGQMPLSRRVPKFGFFNPFRVEYHVVNVGSLQELVDNNKFENGIIDINSLIKAGAVRNSNKPVKILGFGELHASLNISADKFSDSAKQKIESAGGTVTLNG
ncbi:MAG: large subunit ribosomal protein [Bacteroidota bacterium]|nr:large subunit ribosomal protein [Bacteroidota bacterium]